MLQNYLACGGNSSQTVDFFSLNAYEWCGSSSFETSGYSTLQDQTANFPLPIFFSETGCNTVPPRTFSDQAAIFGSDMVNTWSGAIIYEWIQEANAYGLVSYGGDPTASGGVIVRSGSPTPISPDFENLKSQWSTLTPTGVSLSAYSASASSLSTPVCPTSSQGAWLINGNPPIPTIGQSANFNPTASQVPSAAATATGASQSAQSASPSPGAKGAASSGIQIMGWTVMAALATVGLVFVLLL